ncbi:preprotein translocase subunit YajC [Nocardia sp. BMG51109]|uniref:preprotein translocase subunit YajC n=1 Tax=Nocardia sp. BMG51109 TaxID=1056816 RepID=UPI0004667F6F
MELLFPLLLVALLVPMFLGVRRQKREAEKVASMQATVKIGDRVTTTSGLYGTVVDTDDTTVDIEIAEDVVTTWLRAAVRDVRTDDAETTETAEPADEAAASESTQDKSAEDKPTEHKSTEHESTGTAPTQAKVTSDATAGTTAVEESVEDTAGRLSKD